MTTVLYRGQNINKPEFVVFFKDIVKKDTSYIFYYLPTYTVTLAIVIYMICRDGTVITKQNILYKATGTIQRTTHRGLKILNRLGIINTKKIRGKRNINISLTDYGKKLLDRWYSEMLLEIDKER